MVGLISLLWVGLPESGSPAPAFVHLAAIQTGDGPPITPTPEKEGSMRCLSFLRRGDDGGTNR